MEGDMTEYPSFSNDEAKRIVYVRAVKTADLPAEIQAQSMGRDHLYAIHAPTGQVLALVADRNQAFLVARQNEFDPVSVH
jgi:hypothetical protein